MPELNRQNRDEREYGHRAKIGLIVPANNNVIEPEFQALAPEGVAFYATRLPVEGQVTDETFRRMEEESDRAMRELMTAGVQTLAFCDMGIALVMDEGWGEQRVARIQKTSGLPATTGALAMLDALRELKAKRIAIVTPYPKTLHDRAGPFFERYGFPCVSDSNLPIPDPAHVGKTPPSRVDALIREADHPEAEAVLLLATDIRSIEVIPTAESELDKPVISTNTSLMWKALRLCGVETSPVECGRLFSM